LWGFRQGFSDKPNPTFILKRVSPFIVKRSAHFIVIDF
jgi:hypothetical protein